MIEPQLPLALRATPDECFERYVGAPVGMLEQLCQVAGGHATTNVYLQGARAAGKTHVLLASCAEAEAAQRSSVYLPLRTLKGRLRAAVSGLGGALLLAIDDLDAIAGVREDELALFDLHNQVHDGGGVLLYAGQGAPNELGVALPDLRSRLSQCVRWTLPTLDDDGRAEVLRLRAAARGLDFDTAALDWLLRRCSRDLNSLTSALDRLDRASMAAQRRLTVPFLRQILEHASPL